MTDEDIAAQIASDPDAAPGLTNEWFECEDLSTARLLRGRVASARGVIAPAEPLSLVRRYTNLGQV
jgi:hypothetical protein